MPADAPTPSPRSIDAGHPAVPAAAAEAGPSPPTSATDTDLGPVYRPDVTRAEARAAGVELGDTYGDKTSPSDDPRYPHWFRTVAGSLTFGWVASPPSYGSSPH